jgi:hypothetical protein
MGAKISLGHPKGSFGNKFIKRLYFLKEIDRIPNSKV